MSDPKYIPKDGGLYHSDGYRIPDDEPLMVFRGKDIGALSAICDYIEMLLGQPLNPVIDSHLKSSTERLNAFYDYQMENPNLQSIGCTKRSHADSYDHIIARAKDLLEELQ